MIDYRLLTHEQLMQENFKLTQIIDNLKKEKEELDKCTATVYSPNKSYKDFEKKVTELTEENLSLVEKITILEEEKQKEINLLKAENYKISNMLSVAEQKLSDKLWNNIELKQRNTDLEKVIEKQNMVINLAAGYISSCEQFRNEYPTNVQKWLMGGMQ